MKLIKISLLIIILIIVTSCRENSGITESNVTTIEPIISNEGRYVRSPSGIDELRMGSRFKILWSLPEEILGINLYLFRDGKYLLTIVKNTWNDGQYKWEIPLDVEISRKYQIKIESSRDPSLYGFSNHFLITR